MPHPAVTSAQDSYDSGTESGWTTDAGSVCGSVGVCADAGPAWLQWNAHVIGCKSGVEVLAASPTAGSK